MKWPCHGSCSRRLLIAETRARSQASPCGICGRQSGPWTGFCPSTWISSYSVIPPVLRRNTVVRRRTSRPSLGTFIHGSVLLIILYRLTEKCVHIVLSLRMVPSVESLFQRYILSSLIVRSVWLQYNIHDTLTSFLAFTVRTKTHL